MPNEDNANRSRYACVVCLRADGIGNRRDEVAAGCLTLGAWVPLPIVDRSTYEDNAGYQTHVDQPVVASPDRLMLRQYSHSHRYEARFTLWNDQSLGPGGLLSSRNDVVC
jgi:hypothetical protein